GRRSPDDLSLCGVGRKRGGRGLLRRPIHELRHQIMGKNEPGFLARLLILMPILNIASEVLAHPLPHGRGSVTEPRASASGHSLVLLTPCLVCLGSLRVAEPRVPRAIRRL